MSLCFNSWQEAGIQPKPSPENQKVYCPQCTASRRNKRDRSLSVNLRQGLFNCHHCGWAGKIRSEELTSLRAPTKPEVKALDLSAKVRDWFLKERHIEARVLEYFKITESIEWMPGKGDIAAGPTTCIHFNYYEGNELINTKFRGGGKRFRMIAGARLVFYNLNAIKDADQAIICEGEIDCMSFYQAGFYYCVSVPNGASRGNQKLEYLDNTIAYFESKKKIYIATDADEPGMQLRDELIRRLGRERCYVVTYPEGCKDANEVLVKYGTAGVKRIIESAELLPLEGIFSALDLAENVRLIFKEGFPKGTPTGYCELDKLITFRQGELTTITGIPNSGKSQFVDQLLVRLAARAGWRFGIFSPEQQPTELHVSGLCEKFIGEPMFGPGQMNPGKLEKALKFVNDHFFFMKQSEMDTTIDGILLKARELVVRKGINGLLIDPYNYIEHKIPKGYSETQYVSELLTKIKRFKEENHVHVFLIAHPVKIQKDKHTGKYNVPTLYDIAGSSHFYNKTDNGLTAYRDFETNIFTVYVQKIRFRFVGKIGSCDFKYDVSTGRYAHLEDQFDSEIRSGRQIPLDELVSDSK